MRLNSFEMQEMREIGRKETNELRGFTILSFVRILKDFQVEGKEYNEEDRLKM